MTHPFDLTGKPAIVTGSASAPPSNQKALGTELAERAPDILPVDGGWLGR